MPPIKIHSPESSTRWYIQHLIKKNRAHRKRKLKHKQEFLGRKRPRHPDFDDYEPYPEP